MQQSQTQSIQWREWNQEAFIQAEREAKPILLTLTATWCHWCHVMDQTSYAHLQVIELVNSRFIPIKVDVDRRPDISYRYNQGGFPSVAILNAKGELITGRVYTPPQEMLQLLEQVSAQYPQVGAAQDSLPPSPSQRDTLPLSPSPGASIFCPLEGEGWDGGAAPLLVLNRLQEIYDADFGGFGMEPKQPPWESLKLLLALYSRSRVPSPDPFYSPLTKWGHSGVAGSGTLVRTIGRRPLQKMVSTTLEGIQSGLYDQKDQGFFRYSVSRDWKVPHYEKMLSTNANLSNVYLEAYQVTRRKRYKDLAVGALTYLFSTLHDPDRGLFYASQDAGEEYYRLPWNDREKAEKPFIDRTFYTGLNALAASSLIKAYGVLGEHFYLKAATRVLDLLWNEAWEPSRGLRHVIDQIPASPIYQATDFRLQTTGTLPKPEARSLKPEEGVRPVLSRVEGGDFPSFLSDHVFTAAALLDLYQATGNSVGEQQAAPLHRTTALMQRIRELFGAPDGGFYDVPVPLSAKADSLAPLPQGEPSPAPSPPFSQRETSSPSP